MYEVSRGEMNRVQVIRSENKNDDVWGDSGVEKLVQKLRVERNESGGTNGRGRGEKGGE